MSQDYSHYDAVIADMEAKRDQLTAVIESLRAMKLLVVGVSLPTPPTVSAKPTTEELSHDAFFNMTIPDAARKYLANVKRTKSTFDIAEALLKGGLKTTAVNFRDTLRSVLSKHPDFVRVNGEVGLAEWYGNVRKERKARKGHGAQADSETGIDEPSAPSDRDEEILQDSTLALVKAS